MRTLFCRLFHSDFYNIDKVTQIYSKHLLFVFYGKCFKCGRCWTFSRLSEMRE